MAERFSQEWLETLAKDSLKVATDQYQREEGCDLDTALYAFYQGWLQVVFEYAGHEYVLLPFRDQSGYLLGRLE